jgi:hypothetical protein
MSAYRRAGMTVRVPRALCQSIFALTPPILLSRCRASLLIAPSLSTPGRPVHAGPTMSALGESILCSKRADVSNVIH